MMYNRYGDDFLIDKIQPEEIGEELVNVGELVADKELQIINKSEHSLSETGVGRNGCASSFSLTNFW